MSRVEQTARERALNGLCESQRQELQEVREALRQRAAAESDAEVNLGGERSPRSSGQAELEGATDGNAGTAIGEYANQHLAAIDDLLCALQAATSSYRRRPLDWDDVASLRFVREQLNVSAKGFAATEAAATVRRAAREVAIEVRQFRVSQ